jgi:hypothetical protein
MPVGSITGHRHDIEMNSAPPVGTGRAKHQTSLVPAVQHTTNFKLPSWLLMNYNPEPSQMQAFAEAITHLPQETSGMLGRIHDWAVAHPELCGRLKIPETVAITKISTSVWDYFFDANRKLTDTGHEPISTNDLSSIPAETGAEFISESQFVEDPEMKEL